MIYILLSIVCSTCIFVIFRKINDFQANARQCILVSYAISSITTIVIFSVSIGDILSPWLAFAAFEGAVFYLVFRLIARSTKISGIAVTSIASKMSVVIPISIGILALGEKVNWLILAGIGTGFLSVWLSVGSKGELDSWKWPILVFIGSGLIDSSFKILQVWGLSEHEFPGFIVTVFIFAFVSALFHHFMKSDRVLSENSVFFGSILGLANLGTIYFLLVALSSPSLSSVFVYSLTNFGIVLLSTLVAVVIFREKLELKGRLGVASGLISIAFLYNG